MKMAKVEEPLVIIPGESIKFEPGGLHLMLFDLKAGLKEGETFSENSGLRKLVRSKSSLQWARWERSLHQNHRLTQAMRVTTAA